jgi:hypothetical protein
MSRAIQLLGSTPIRDTRLRWADFKLWIKNLSKTRQAWYPVAPPRARQLGEAVSIEQIGPKL